MAEEEEEEEQAEEEEEQEPEKKPTRKSKPANKKPSQPAKLNRLKARRNLEPEVLPYEEQDDAPIDGMPKHPRNFTREEIQEMIDCIDAQMLDDEEEQEQEEEEEQEREHKATRDEGENAGEDCGDDAQAAQEATEAADQMGAEGKPKRRHTCKRAPSPEPAAAEANAANHNPSKKAKTSEEEWSHDRQPDALEAGWCLAPTYHGKECFDLIPMP